MYKKGSFCDFVFVVVVTECSVIKDLIDDLDVMDNVCELFNTRKRAIKVQGLKHLGKKLGIKKEILDDLLLVQEETQSPTEALIHHLRGKNPGLTLRDFIWALHYIDRPDVITVLEAYLPGTITVVDKWIPGPG